jgi:hypothetical protein
MGGRINQFVQEIQVNSTTFTVWIITVQVRARTTPMHDAALPTLIACFLADYNVL